ncbi:hypothetical protein OH77DRAFT_1594079 [Trametes cingulata]|nr:hypothetical protein OH77DRAFT_1594079 [Trametes cingulata]
MSSHSISLRQLIEDALAASVQLVIDLKSHLNDTTAIARLPPELLSEIFLHVVEDRYGEVTTSYSPCSSRFYKWIVVTHVCRRWRAIALDTAKLWSYVILTRSSVVREVLSRSRKAPLSICATISSSADERVVLLGEVMEEPPRLKSLHLYGPVDVVHELCNELVGSSGVNLERMVLFDTEPPSEIDDEPAPTLTSLEVQSPRLRSLEVYRLPFAWKDPVLSSGVTRLIVVGCLDSQQMLGSFDQLLATLRMLSSLRELEIEDAIPRLPDFDDSQVLPLPRSQVVLPRLRYLSLTGYCPDCVRLKDRLTVPSTARLVLRGRGAIGGQGLLRAAGDHIALSSPLLAMHLARVYGTQLLVQGWRSLADADHAAEPSLVLQMDILHFPPPAAHHVYSAKVFSAVRSLQIFTADRDWRWRSVLPLFPDLEVLSVRRNPQRAFLRVLSTTHAQKRNHAPLTILPQLRVLKITFARMRHPRHTSGIPTALDELLDWLLFRCNHNAPIDELHLRSCFNFTQEDVLTLEEVVPHVVWDGAVQIEYEEDGEEFSMPYDSAYDYGHDEYYGNVAWAMP